MRGHAAPPSLVDAERPVDLRSCGLDIVEDPESIFPQFLHHRLERVAPEIDQPLVAVHDTGIDEIPDVVIDAGTGDIQVARDPLHGYAVSGDLVRKERDENPLGDLIDVPAFPDTEAAEEPLKVVVPVFTPRPLYLPKDYLPCHRCHRSFMRMGRSGINISIISK